MNEFYTLKVAGLERNLPVVPVSDSLAIASFVLLGDAEMAKMAAQDLIKRLPPVDYLITAEAKGIPLVQEMAVQMQQEKFIVARKSVKTYMKNPLIEQVKSITTADEQNLCLDGNDAGLIRGKKVALVDDVISSGNSIAVLKRLVEKAGAEVVAQAAILAEGEASDRDDLIYLEKLPTFAIK